jgi:dolichyl-phosphate beta-glucosyltransferase
MELSIVIPAFDEELKISRDILDAGKFLKNHNIEGEIIIVDDGSRDNTFKIAEEQSRNSEIECRILKNDSNEGKGSAVRKGLLASRGSYVLYTDAGLTVPFDFALKGIELIKSGECGFAFGSRKLLGSKITRSQDWDRKIASKLMFNIFKKLFDIPEELTDTQCGFKVYNGDKARELFAELTIKGFLFEIEIILLAGLKGVEIKEFPVEWKCDRDSRLSFRRSSVPIIRDILKLRKLYANI